MNEILSFPPTQRLRSIRGFETLKAIKHGRDWMIVDCTCELNEAGTCTDTCTDAIARTLGLGFPTLRELREHAEHWYTGHYS